MSKVEVLQYVNNFVPPAEAYFFTQQEKDTLAQQEKKLEATRDYVRMLQEKPELMPEYEKASMSGKVYSPGQAANVIAILRALDGAGERTDVRTSLVSPTGQIIIMSDNCARSLGLPFDSYVTADEIPRLLRVLKDERVSQTDMDNVAKAAADYGAIILQRGAFFALKAYLDETAAVSSVRASYKDYKNNLERSVPDSRTSSPVPPHGASLSALKAKLDVAKPSAPASSGTVTSPAEIKRELEAKELPAHNGMPNLRPPAPPMSSNPIEKNFTPTPPDHPASWVSASPAPKPSANATQATTTPVKLNSVPKGTLGALSAIKVVDDLKKIESAHLRQGYLPEQIKLIRTRIAYLATANKLLPIQVATIFEQSPLFKLYLQVGSAIMSQSTHDKKADFREVIAGMASSGSDILSFQEFEAMADLRKDLERM